MPGPKDPHATDHFVYVFHANGCPFYVGHGHLGRLQDRPIYVDRLARLHPDYSYYKWTLHGMVISELWKARVEVYFDQLSQKQTKAEANRDELNLTFELLTAGFLLANEAGNSNVRPYEEIAAAVLVGGKRWDFLTTFKPLNRYVRPRR